jgi:hypothetical protein
MKPSAPKCLTAALATVALAACQQPSGNPPANATSATVSASASAPVISALPASAGSAALPGDHTTTKRYKIAISLPTLPAGEKSLSDALRTTANHAKRQFLQALPNPRQHPEFANRQFELLLNFKTVANTRAFTSVREVGERSTGGAHPVPIEAAFVYDRKATKLITLDDLFTRPSAARKALANFAHDTLLKKFMAHAPTPSEGSPQALREWKSNTVQMLNDGTKPTSVNYSVFVVRAGPHRDAPSPGLELIFPPYQVAPYVEGTQTVKVPAKVFAQYLKPQYASDFSNPSAGQHNKR